MEQLVDDVVSGYYNGFNKAIANYSQILHLFTSAQEQVTTARPSGLKPLSTAFCALQHTLQHQDINGHISAHRIKQPHHCP